jgi:hypothetical protein
MKMTLSPALMDVMPFNAKERAKAFELSSTLQPVISIADVVVLVTSNQSAATELLPLDHGATSEMKSFPTVPGDPISVVPPWVTENALFSPTTLARVIVALSRPALLSKVANGLAPGEPPTADAGDK